MDTIPFSKHSHTSWGLSGVVWDPEDTCFREGAFTTLFGATTTLCADDRFPEWWQLDRWWNERLALARWVPG